MAKVGTAYVNIRPDLSGFAAEVKEKLAKVQAQLAVKLVPDLKGFQAAAKAELARVVLPDLAAAVKPDTSLLAEQLKAAVAATPKPTIEIETHVDHDRLGRAMGEAMRGAQSIVATAATEVGKVAATAMSTGLQVGVATAGNATIAAEGFAASMTNPIGVAFIALGVTAAAAFAVSFGAGLVGALIPAVAGLGLAGLGVGLAGMLLPSVRSAWSTLADGAMVGLKTAVKPLEQPLLELAASLGPRLGPLVDQLSTLFTGLAPLIGPLGTALTSFSENLLGGLIEGLPGMMAALNPLIAALPGLGSVLGGLFQMLSRRAPEIEKIMNVVLPNIKAVLIGVIAVLDIGITVTAWFAEKWQQVVTVFGVVEGVIGAAIAAIKAHVLGGVEKIQTVVDEAWTKVKDTTSEAWQRIQDAVSTAIDTVVSTVTTVPTLVGDALSGLPDTMASAGRAIVIGLWSGISSLGGWLSGLVSSFVRDNIIGTVADILDWHSPSKVFMQIGKDTVRGFALGFTREAKKLDLAVPGLRIPTVPAFAQLSTLAGMATATQRFLVQVMLDGKVFDNAVVNVIDLDNEMLARGMLAGRSGVG